MVASSEALNLVCTLNLIVLNFNIGSLKLTKRIVNHFKTFSGLKSSYNRSKARIFLSNAIIFHE